MTNYPEQERRSLIKVVLESRRKWREFIRALTGQRDRDDEDNEEDE